jgi:AcrR family transcriptional regulator
MLRGPVRLHASAEGYGIREQNMSEPRKERADAARNRRAILAATERLLEAHRAQDISMDQVAAGAGVGKGTIFHRFGSRAGLMRALMVERAQSLSEAIAGGPPPLGPGAADRDRLLAFLDAMLETVARNKSLLSELAHTEAARVSAPDAPAPADAGGNGNGAGDKGETVYSVWHSHLSGLLAAERPDVDAALTAHLILGTLHSEPVLARITADGPKQVAAALRAMVSALLDVAGS